MSIRYTSDLIDSCSGRPPQGCRLCDRGAKMVLYITGVCMEDCFYCPLSEEKKGNDVTFANERRVDGDDWLDMVVLEARRMKALGTGITGGDPMAVVDRTVQAISRLRSEFGPRHHMHLYTTGSFDKEALGRVKKAGLDEIRFHPPVWMWGGFRFLGRDHEQGDPAEARQVHELIHEARRSKLSTGLEVPALVDPRGSSGIYSRGLYHLLEYAAREGIDFVNVNELEASHTNMGVFKRLGYDLVGDSMAVKGSYELAFRTIEKVRDIDHQRRTVFHICTSVYKDSIQLRNRLIRTAKNTARPFEIVTEDGTFLRGIIETDDPSNIYGHLSRVYDVPPELMVIENGKVLIAPWVLEELGPEIEGTSYISEVYPTCDALEVERTPIEMKAPTRRFNK